MSEIMSDICARLKPFLQKIGLSSSQNTSNVPRIYRTGGAPGDRLVFSRSTSLKPKSAPPRRQAPPLLNRGGELSFILGTLCVSVVSLFCRTPTGADVAKV